VVELMRQGLSPEAACKKAIERIVKIKKEKVKDIQVAFIAINKKGETGSFAIHKGFNYAIKNKTTEKLVDAKAWFAS
ncbi:MAG: glycosylasparaginase, partial [Chitinophagaceae bacterium]